MGFEEADIGGHHVAGFQQHHVAGHEVGGGHGHGVVFAQHHGPVGRHLLQGLHRLIGPVLLQKADDGVEQHDGQDNVGRFFLANQHRNPGRRQQHQNHDVGQLVEQQLPNGFLLRVCQAVGAVRSQSLPGRALVEASGGGAQRQGHVGYRGKVVFHKEN